MSDPVEGALAELAEVYRRVDAECVQSDCRACGRCCHFETFGHRVYLTWIEALYLQRICGAAPGAFGPDSCGYQDGVLCRAREGRALACRVFFCRGEEEAGAEMYERFLDEIRRISDRHGLRWDYKPIALHAAQPE